MTETELIDEIDALYGRVDWAAAEGLLHVAAIALTPPRAIAIGPAAPASETDRFVLGFARARADVIVTTGSILRAEPELTHAYSSDSAENAAFALWREGSLGRAESPQICVLSQSGRFPTDHPAIRGAHAGIVWTTPEGAHRIGEDLGSRWTVEPGIAPGGGLPGSIEAMIAHLRSQMGARAISIEAGPTVSGGLYPAGSTEPEASVCRPTCWVDELLLSRYCGELAREAVGPAFVAPERIARRFGTARSRTPREESSGSWLFERYSTSV
jgi:riboflavin biosynthesis pyrimidine reductase